MFWESTKAILVGEDKPLTINSTFISGSLIVGSALMRCADMVEKPQNKTIKPKLSMYNMTIRFLPQYNYNKRLMGYLFYYKRYLQ